MQFSHTSLENQFSSPKRRTEKKEEEKEESCCHSLAPGAYERRHGLSNFVLAMQDTAFCISAQNRNLSIKDVIIIFVENTHSHPSLSLAFRYLSHLNSAKKKPVQTEMILGSITSEYHHFWSREMAQAAAVRFEVRVLLSPRGVYSFKSHKTKKKPNP